MIYLDANATTPMLPEAVEAMLPWLTENYANPSAIYRASKLVRKAMDRAREQVAALIGADPEEIVFTGSGTESVNSALNSLNLLAGEGNALVSAIEHSAVLRFLEEEGERRFEKAAVDAQGMVDFSAFSESCGNAAYVSVMTANNETGMIQPIEKIASCAREFRRPMHTDAIQAAGKIPIDVRSSGVDMLSLSAHKFYGPKGIGALYVRHGLQFSPLLQGGGQENGRRSSTENVAGIVAMGAAAEYAKKGLEEGVAEQIREMRDAFEEFLLNEVSGTIRNGDPAHRLPNTSHLSFEHCDSAGMLILLDEAGVACSAGSACMTGKQQPSHVQLAMGIPVQRAKTSLRFSISRFNTQQEVMEAARKVQKAVEKLRKVQGRGVGPVAVYTD